MTPSRRTSHKIGLSPGSLVYIGDKQEAPTQISIIDYDSTRMQEIQDATIEDVCRFMQADSVTWINVSGIHNTGTIKSLGEALHLHPLVLEDIVNTEQRPKLDDYDDYIFVVTKMATIADGEILVEQMSMVLGNRYVICFQEIVGDVFNPVRERIKKGKGRIRGMGADYLAYALLDMVVDHYYVLLEAIGETIEDLQEKVISEPGAEILAELQDCRRKVVDLRKSIWPLREMFAGLLRGDSAMIGEDVVVFFKDVYDHTLQVADSLETYRELLSGVFDIYLSNVSNKMNQVMKVLTIIATLFIPTTFLAGIYGMNFKYMPELEWQWAYPAFWGLVLVVFAVMLGLFKRKNWF